LALYRKERLAAGAYRSLYVHGFDRPEAYVVEKDGRFYFAFYADGGPATSRGFKGALELRGLSPGRYRVRDEEDGRDLGVVVGPKGRLEVSFEHHLLLEAAPE
jgi:alpha-galactosidase